MKKKIKVESVTVFYVMLATVLKGYSWCTIKLGKASSEETGSLCASRKH